MQLFDMPLVPRTCVRCGLRPELISRGGKRRSWCNRCLNKHNYELRQANPEKYRTQHRRAYLKRVYGITYEHYHQMLEAQGGGCAICGVERDREIRNNGRQELEPTYGALPVDHCHRTGRVRGILCGNCNRVLGLVEDDPARLRAAADYLERTMDHKV